jgi:hypothetical protein
MPHSSVPQSFRTPNIWLPIVLNRVCTTLTSIPLHLHMTVGDRVSGGAAGTTGVGEAAAVQSTTQEDGGDRHSGSKIATAAARGQPASNSNPLAGLPVVTPATQHATLTLITTLSKSFVAVDVPGAAAYRSAWAEVMQYAEAVVLVVSCTDPMR